MCHLPPGDFESRPRLCNAAWLSPA